MLPESYSKLISTIPFATLQKEATLLSSSYRLQTEGKMPFKPFMDSYARKIAYLALRMPATYAAVLECLGHIHGDIRSLVDVGSGPGTVYFAADALFPNLEKVHLIEKDPELIKIARQLIGSVPSVQYQAADMTDIQIPQADLVTAAYTLTEIPSQLLENTLKNLWIGVRRYLCIVEPGTPYGFALISKVRDILIQMGGFIVAPCTHEKQCPLVNSSLWCHFATRFERPSEQQKIKSASLGYEDEKYSYLIVSKIPSPRPFSRVIKTPEKHSGHLRLTLCNERGLEEKVVSKKAGDFYRECKKLEWGSPLDLN